VLDRWIAFLEHCQRTNCDWSYPQIQNTTDFSYGATLASLVGWLGYGGNLTWLKQRYLVETVFGIPLSQGSLAKMHRWFCESLYPSYEQWWTYIQEYGVRCVDETSYRVNVGLIHSNKSQSIKSLSGKVLRRFLRINI
jgi:hypothetical protein